MSDVTLEKQVKEFDFQLKITNRLKELNSFKDNTEKELQQAQQYIQQKTTELNVLMGAISELETLMASAK